MASSSALDVEWKGEKWPPEEAAAASAGNKVTIITGVVLQGTRRLDCRRATVQRGFLASKKTLDVTAKYTQLTVRLTGGDYAALKRQCGAFADLVSPSAGFFPPGGGEVVRVWASPTIVADLAARDDCKVPDPLMQEGDAVKLALLPGTLLCAGGQVELVSAAKRAPRMSIMGETHMFGVVQKGPVQVDAKGGMTDRIFAAKASLPTSAATVAAAPPTSSDVKDEEWE